MPDPLPTLLDVNTLGAMSSRVKRWARENVNPDILVDAINDAIESLWMAASLATLSKFMGHPVQQMIPAQSTNFTLITIPDPADYLVGGETGGGVLPARQYDVSYCLVTDSGSHTAESPSVVVEVDLANLLAVNPPVPLSPDAIGWNLYVGVAGRRVLQNVTPLPFDQLWIEPVAGANLAPDGPLPPRDNTTGDSIFSIARLDIANPQQSGTFTNWLQTNVGSTSFTAFQNRYPYASTYPRHAYDLIGNTTVEFRPAAGMDMDATLFYVTRPRRLRFPISRLPFTNFASQRFIFTRALADVLLSVYENEASDKWQEKADKELQLVLLSILGEQWNQNTTVRPYMR